MATWRVLVTTGFLVISVSDPSIAMSPPDTSTEVKACKSIANDKDRLKCFDRLFGETSEPKTPPERAQANWSIEETKSADGSAQVVAANLLGDVVLILRCKNQITEAAFSTQWNYLGSKAVDVELRINNENPVKEVWKASVNGRAAFAPEAVAFIQSLPDNGNLSIKTTRSTDGKVREAHFNLGAVSEVKTKIATACDWPGGSVDDSVGSIREEK